MWEGLAIVNQLRRHPAPVTALIDGIAASAASFIACGGADQIIMGRNAQLMIHDAWGMCVGNAGDMRDLAERLDKISDNIASIYSDRAGGDTATWRAAMLEESWYNADEAVAAGLADTVEDAPQAAMDTRSQPRRFPARGPRRRTHPLAPVATAEEYDATRDPGRRLRDSKAGSAGSSRRHPQKTPTRNRPAGTPACSRKGTQHAHHPAAPRAAGQPVRADEGGLRQGVGRESADDRRGDRLLQPPRRRVRQDRERDRPPRALAAREANQVRKDPTVLDLGGEGEIDKSDEAYERAFTNFLRKGMNGLSAEDHAIMAAARDEKILNAAGVGTGAAGGFTVAPEFRDKLVETQKWYGPMLQEAEVIYTDTGAQLPWPTNDDTGNVGAILAENTQVTEQDVVFGQAALDAYMYTSKLVRVSYQLLQDSAFDINTWLPKKLGQRLGRILNQHFTTGTGTNQPDGIVTSATVGVTGTGSFATTGGISFDNAIDLIEALDQPTAPAKA